jgi:peptidoglycan L-alanyl-D-glutamate endopeptidase CwlK
MASRQLSDLHPTLHRMANDFIMRCENFGIDLLIYCTYRSPTEQTALYAQGREPLDTTNLLRKQAGLYALSPGQNQIVVTHAPAGESFHNYRLAFDCVSMDVGKPVWDEADPVWQRMGEIGEIVGLLWAGRWNDDRKEFPHFQWSNHLSLVDLQAGKMPMDEVRV